MGVYKTRVYKIQSGQVVNWQVGSHHGSLQRRSERFRTALCSEEWMGLL